MVYIVDLYFNDDVSKMSILQATCPAFSTEFSRNIRLLSLKEISLITGQTKNTTAVQLHRTVSKLKSLINTPRSQLA